MNILNKLWDTHMHTSFSYDGEYSMQDMAKQAKSLGLAGICFTDHLDPDLPEPNHFDFCTFDIPKYLKAFSELKTSGIEDDSFHMLCGAEFGIRPHLVGTLAEISREYPLDYIIGSTHVVNGIDPYYPEYYAGRTEDAAYEEYFKEVLENITLSKDYDVCGHLDYVVRYGPNKNKYYSYKKYADIIDEILKTVIADGKGLEVNSAGFRKGLGAPNPTADVIRRFKELGGEIITIGSDAHNPGDIAADFDRCAALIESCGFKYFAVYKKRKPEFFRLK